MEKPPELSVSVTAVIADDTLGYASSAEPTRLPKPSSLGTTMRLDMSSLWLHCSASNEDRVSALALPLDLKWLSDGL